MLQSTVSIVVKGAGLYPVVVECRSLAALPRIVHNWKEDMLQIKMEQDLKTTRSRFLIVNGNTERKHHLLFFKP